MKTLNIMAFFLAIGVNQPLSAHEDDCTTNTNPLAFEQVDKKHILEQISQKESSRTLTFFTNGDLLISNVEECGLGLELLYLSQLPFESAAHRIDKLKWLVNLNGRDIASLLSKHNLSKVPYEFSVHGENTNEAHQIKSAMLIDASDTYPETFSESISYIWVPPLGAE